MSAHTAALAADAAAAWRHVARLCDLIPEGRMDERAIEAERRAEACESDARRLAPTVGEAA